MAVAIRRTRLVLVGEASRVGAAAIFSDQNTRRTAVADDAPTPEQVQAA